MSLNEDISADVQHYSIQMQNLHEEKNFSGTGWRGQCIFPPLRTHMKSTWKIRRLH